METECLLARLLSLKEATAQQAFFQENADHLNDAFAESIKGEADRLLRSDSKRSLSTAGLLLQMAEISGEPHHRALGLLATANVYCLGGLGEYQKAVELYDEGAAIYAQAGDQLREARSQNGKLYALAFLGRYSEALDIGQWASGILRKHGDWRMLADMTLNLGLICGRMGDDQQSLALFEKAGEIYHQFVQDGHQFAPWVEHNRAVALRNLGHFEASIKAAKEASRMLEEMDQRIEVARAQQNLALTYYVLGRYNEALVIFDRVGDIFQQDGRIRDAILANLYMCDCFLELRRFAEVLETCARIRREFSKLGTRYEVAQAQLNEAVAFAGLNRHEEALTALAAARELFQQEGNEVWVACSDMERALILQKLGQYKESLETAQVCIRIFQAHNLQLRMAQAQLVACKAMAAFGEHSQSKGLIVNVLRIAEAQDVPTLKYECERLSGHLVNWEREPDRALAHIDKAIQALERLHGRLMIEFRSDYLEDKASVYEDAVLLCLKLNQTERALAYAERAKSRALLDMIGVSLDLRLRARTEEDESIVADLIRSRRERDRLYRRWEGREYPEETHQEVEDSLRHETRDRILGLEKHISSLWHRLLIRNADYARDASLWHVRPEQIRPFLAEDIGLLEFFIANQQLIVFCVTRQEAYARPLTLKLSELHHLLQFLWLNIRAVPGSPDSQVNRLAQQARVLLNQLYKGLMSDLASELAEVKKLIIVPHGPLHYLPFQALFDGSAYLLEKMEVSYLPASSLYRYLVEPGSSSSRNLIMGHSRNGRLPFTLKEAQSVAAIMGAEPLIEGEATLENLRKSAPGCRTIHLATHGEFRSDNPLFSGISLADGWLTTLDIFDLKLNASLVTLSACQTGRSVLGGGDELLGLARALLYAGASSLVLSLWPIEDEATAQIMTSFYQGLAEGRSKGTALQLAQREFLRASREDSNHVSRTHPYYWASFYLVGNTGLIGEEL